MAKMMLRGVNFSCSLIVLSMLAATFTIFNATRSLPARNNLPAWAPGTSTWPQIVLLSIACVSLAMSVGIMWAYWRGGHRRAEKAAVYYTVFAVVFFVFSTIMWGIGAGILNGSKVNGNGTDLWGWSCKNNKRSQLFKDEVSYSLVCRLQVSSLVFRSPKPECSLDTELVTCLLYHRNRCGNHHHHHLCNRLLPFLLQAQAPQVHGHSRQSALRPLPRSTPHTVCTEHTWLCQNAHVFDFPSRRSRRTFSSGEWRVLRHPIRTEASIILAT